ncbi:hypothetical protein B0T21DRAFT_411341 [Apiosordaria backusii]|uniref:Uncharacterized protein n=1 Tax=Apiosordaria backusii TaxID=314023 RepID=A0AA40EDQ0_9PEZI|nr:hypothetical protein B0T21DRAFT_411341 [Apiosordaria backusii]
MGSSFSILKEDVDASPDNTNNVQSGQLHQNVNGEGLPRMPQIQALIETSGQLTYAQQMEIKGKHAVSSHPPLSVGNTMVASGPLLTKLSSTNYSLPHFQTGTQYSTGQAKSACTTNGQVAFLENERHFTGFGRKEARKEKRLHMCTSSFPPDTVEWWKVVALCLLTLGTGPSSGQV